MASTRVLIWCLSWRIEPQIELNSILWFNLPNISEDICFRPRAKSQCMMPAGRPQVGRRRDAGRTQARRGPDAGETQLRALTDAGETRFARVLDAVFDKLFLGSTVFSVKFFIYLTREVDASQGNRFKIKGSAGKTYMNIHTLPAPSQLTF